MIIKKKTEYNPLDDLPKELKKFVLKNNIDVAKLIEEELKSIYQKYMHQKWNKYPPSLKSRVLMKYRK